MEKRPEEKLKTAKHLSLTNEERERMGALLASYREIHPVRLHTSRQERSTAGVWIMIARTATAMALVGVFLGGGVVAVAEQALPGDFLYSVKTSTEDVRSALTLDQEASVRYEAERVERRLKEAEELASQGSVSKRAAEHLSVELENRTGSLQTRLEQLKVEQAETVLEIESEFHSKSRIYSHVLKSLAKNGSELDGLTETLARIGEGLEPLPSRLARESTSEEEEPEGEEKDDSQGEEGSEVSISSLEGPEELPEDERVENGDEEESEQNSEETQDAERELEAADSEDEDQVDPATIKALQNVTERTVADVKSSLEDDTEKIQKKVRTVLQERLKHAQQSLEEGKKLQAEGSQQASAKKSFERALFVSQDVRTILELARTADDPEAFISLFKEIEAAEGQEVLENVREEVRAEEAEGAPENSEDNTASEDSDDAEQQDSETEDPEESDSDASSENEGDTSLEVEIEAEANTSSLEG